MSNAANKMLRTITGVGSDTASRIMSELSYGTVTSINPLKITRETESGRTEYTAGFLVLSRTCKELTAQTATSGEIVQVWPGLSVGEKVILLSFNGNQKFFVERM